LQPTHSSGARAEWRKCALTRLRVIEIGAALVLTLAAVLFVGFTLWAAREQTLQSGETTIEADVPN
jgi:hypothetical protein